MYSVGKLEGFSLRDMMWHACREAFVMLVNNQDRLEEPFSASFFRFSFCINEMFGFESLSHARTHAHTESERERERLVAQSSQ